MFPITRRIPVSFAITAHILIIHLWNRSPIGSRVLRRFLLSSLRLSFPHKHEILALAVLFEHPQQDVGKVYDGAELPKPQLLVLGIDGEGSVEDIIVVVKRVLQDLGGGDIILEWRQAHGFQEE